MPGPAHLKTWLLAMLGTILLAGCQTTDLRGFSRAQTDLLRAEGFVETVEGWELSIADRLLFDHDSAEVKPAMQETIGRVAAGLLRVGIDAARVEGHSDATGAPEYNARLSEARASAVAAVMLGRGFSATNLALRGWGEARPIADNGSEDGRAQNRRVVIIVTAR